jgi:hypothetical protein
MCRYANVRMCGYREEEEKEVQFATPHPKIKMKETG